MMKKTQNSNTTEPKKPRKKIKLIIRIIFYGFALIAAIHIIHMLTFDRIIQYKRLTFCSENVTDEIDGYKIAFITDTHFITPTKLTNIVEMLNAENLDLMLLGGDYSMSMANNYVAEMSAQIEILSSVKTADGIFGVDGNHDYPRPLFEAMHDFGITPLPNTGMYISDTFFLAGVQDFHRGASVISAIKTSRNSDFVLLISHNPDLSMSQNTVGIDLILSGHTHGGQATFFGLWAPYFTFTKRVSAHGQRFRAGFSESADGVPVFVSRGTGEYVPRVFARPQVVIITLAKT
ncbi:MAG: metallophosphoesterase [Oscillospiraceae bacterium]|nr:metallophosphoesterase [Oscillospiraceae bacterium]